MNYELAKKAQKIAEQISIKLFGTKAMAELCLPEAYAQIRKEQQALAAHDAATKEAK